jgi:hypothetical protein
LKALVRGEITDPNDVTLVQSAINSIRRSNPGLIDSKNWELLYSLKNRVREPIRVGQQAAVPSQDVAI